MLRVVPRLWRRDHGAVVACPMGLCQGPVGSGGDVLLGCGYGCGLPRAQTCWQPKGYGCGPHQDAYWPVGSPKALCQRPSWHALWAAACSGCLALHGVHASCVTRLLLTSTLALRLGRHVSLAEIFEPLLLHMYEIASHLGDKGPRGTFSGSPGHPFLPPPLPSSETIRYTR